MNNNRANVFLGIGDDANDGRKPTEWHNLPGSNKILLSKSGKDLGRDIAQDRRDEIRKKTWDEMIEDTDAAYREQENIEGSMSKEEREAIEKAASKLVNAAIEKRNDAQRAKKQQEEERSIELHYKDIDLPQDVQFFDSNAVRDPFCFISRPFRDHIESRPLFQEVLLYYLPTYNVPLSARKAVGLTQIITNGDGCGIGFRKAEVVQKSYFAAYFKFSRKYEKDADRVNENDELLLENIEAEEEAEAERKRRDKQEKERVQRIKEDQISSFVQDAVYIVIVYLMTDIGNMTLDSNLRMKIKKKEQFSAMGKFYTLFFQLK